MYALQYTHQQYTCKTLLIHILYVRHILSKFMTCFHGILNIMLNERPADLDRAATNSARNVECKACRSRSSSPELLT